MMGEIIFKGRKRTRKSGVLGAKEGRYGEIVGTQQYLTLESNVFPCVFYELPWDVWQYSTTGNVREQREQLVIEFGKSCAKQI